MSWLSSVGLRLLQRFDPVFQFNRICCIQAKIVFVLAGNEHIGVLIGRLVRSYDWLNLFRERRQMATSPAVLVMTQAISLGLAFLRRRAAPEFGRGFKPTERLENIPSSRERRLNSIVADATGNENHAHRGLIPTSKFRRRDAARRSETHQLVEKFRGKFNFHVSYAT